MKLPVPVALAAAALALPTAASAATFGAPTPVSGFGTKPALADLAGSAVDRAGSSVLAGTGDFRDTRRPVVAFGAPGSAPGTGTTIGPAGAFDVDVATGTATAAITYTLGHTAYLVTCRGGSCEAPVAVGRASAKPESVVALQPRTGRVTVLWRGRTSGGANRLQWRITTNGRLGRTHTLGEFGERPRIGTDASGKTVAVWTGSRKGAGPDQGVRTAARRKGEFTRPTSIATQPATGLRLATSASGTTVAAWVVQPGGLDVEQPLGTVQVAGRTAGTAFGAPQPLGTVQVAGRTAGTAFGAPQPLGTGTAVGVAVSPAGRALVTALQPASTPDLSLVTAARGSAVSFGPLAALSGPQWVSAAFRPAAAIDDAGNAVVAWVAQPFGGSTGEGVLAASGGPDGTFAAPQRLDAGAASIVTQATTAAIGAGLAQVAWVGPDAIQVARAPLP